jgi:putative nucleotidyltransferase with HDIG domain
MLHVEVPGAVHDLVEVPTDRRVALRLLWLLDDPHASSEAITHVISADPGLSARLLALANASSSCEPGGVTSVLRAASLLGGPAVHAIACTAVLNLFSNRPELPERFWLHAITAGVAAARIAFHMHLDPSEALTAGLLHDFGEQILNGRDPERFDEMLVSMPADAPEARLAIERQVFGIDHATLGAQVLSSHGLPATLTNAVHQHHDTDVDVAPLVRVVRVADCIAEIIEGDTRLDLDATLRAARIEAAGDRLIEQTETDRSVLVKFLAADFQAPRSATR